MKQNIKHLLRRFFTDPGFSDFDALRSDEEAREAIKRIPRSGIIESEKMWCEITRRIKAKRRRTALVWSSAAAVTLAAGMWWQLGIGNATQPMQEPRSVLISAVGGHQIDVQALRDTTIKTNTYNIVLDSVGAISYVLAASGEPAVTVAEAPIVNTVSIPRGAERRLVLPDGTQVWLGSESRLSFKVPFEDGRREVELLGEGYFDVRHNPAHPFTVRAPSMRVTALGTEFNVREWWGEPAVATLVQGAVVVERGSASVPLTPGEQFEVREGRMTIRRVDASLSGAWRTGRFYFNAMPLGEIARQMERWFDVSIVFRSPELERIRFTGVVNRSDGAEQVLRRVARIVPLRWNVNRGTIYIEKD